MPEGLPQSGEERPLNLPLQFDRSTVDTAKSHEVAGRTERNRAQAKPSEGAIHEVSQNAIGRRMGLEVRLAWEERVPSDVIAWRTLCDPAKTGERRTSHRVGSA